MAITVLRKQFARSNPSSQQVHYLHRNFNWNDHEASLASPGLVYLGVLPANCMPLETYIRVNSSFGVDVIVGTSAAGSSAAVCSTNDLVSGATGLTVIDRFMGTYSTLDTSLYVQTATTGATRGNADIWQAYLPGLGGTQPTTN
jgi:hypothetical protein